MGGLKRGGFQNVGNLAYFENEPSLCCHRSENKNIDFVVHWFPSMFIAYLTGKLVGAPHLTPAQATHMGIYGTVKVSSVQVDWDVQQPMLLRSLTHIYRRQSHSTIHMHVPAMSMSLLNCCVVLCGILHLAGLQLWGAVH